MDRDTEALVKRLRDGQVCSIAQNSCRNHYAIVEAADRIEAQLAEIERLREALQEVRSCTSENGGAARALKVIRAALGETE